MIWAIIGVTSWTLPQIMALTFPQLEFIQRGQGPILYPHLKIQIDSLFSNVSDEPDAKTKESPVDKIIREDRERREKIARSEPITPTAKEEKRRAAYQILYGHYTGHVEAEPVRLLKVADPIKGLPRRTAAAIVAYAEAGLFSSDVWARDVAPQWLAVKATADAAP